jgi:hypothetical protein
VRTPLTKPFGVLAVILLAACSAHPRRVDCDGRLTAINPPQPAAGGARNAASVPAAAATRAAAPIPVAAPMPGAAPDRQGKPSAAEFRP